MQRRYLTFWLALSSNYYGIPRSTEVADFVLQLEGNSIEALLERLASDFAVVAQMTFETNTGTLKQELRFKDTEFKVELFRLSNDAHDQERWRRRKLITFAGRQTFLPTAEDVVAWKLRWARTKDRDDVRGVIGVQQDALDWPYIERWCGRHGTLALLEEIRRSVPKV
jgi:hypothetical protein